MDSCALILRESCKVTDQSVPFVLKCIIPLRCNDSHIDALVRIGALGVCAWNGTEEQIDNKRVFEWTSEYDTEVNVRMWMWCVFVDAWFLKTRILLRGKRWWDIELQVSMPLKSADFFWLSISGLCIFLSQCRLLCFISWFSISRNKFLIDIASLIHWLLLWFQRTIKW